MAYVRKGEYKKATRMLDSFHIKHSEVCLEAYAVLKYKTEGSLKAIRVIEGLYVKSGQLEFVEAYEILALYYVRKRVKYKVAVKLILKALDKPLCFYGECNVFGLKSLLVRVFVSCNKEKEAKQVAWDMIKRWPSKKAVILKLLNKATLTSK